MKYEPNGGFHLYQPDSEDEAALVRYALGGMVQMVCPHMVMWRRDEARDGAWFPASCGNPIVRPMRQGEPQPTKPYPQVIIVQVALPTAFQEEPVFFCRRHPQMTDESYQWMIQCLDSLVYGGPNAFTAGHMNDSLLVQYCAELFRAFDMEIDRRAHQPQRPRPRKPPPMRPPPETFDVEPESSVQEVEAPVPETPDEEMARILGDQSGATMTPQAPQSQLGKKKRRRRRRGGKH